MNDHIFLFESNAGPVLVGSWELPHMPKAVASIVTIHVTDERATAEHWRDALLAGELPSHAPKPSSFLPSHAGDPDAAYFMPTRAAAKALRATDTFRT